MDDSLARHERAEALDALIAEMEVDPGQFTVWHTEVDSDGYSHDVQDLDLPDALPFDGAMCAAEGCGNTIGYYLWEDEDGYGRPQAGASWNTTYQLPDGRYVCENCVGPEMGEEL